MATATSPARIAAAESSRSRYRPRIAPLSLFDRIAHLLTQEGAGPAAAVDDQLRISVAALLVEAARMDDRFDRAERETIVRLLIERFDLGETEAAGLLAAAERAVDRSTQLFRFSQEITRTLGTEDRARIVEMLWEVAYADGVLSASEDALIRRVAALIYVDDEARMAARQRVRRRLGIDS
jgi:uncharacterized tellurite resistance protein B-like protein